jgi:hypothetical protein
LVEPAFLDSIDPSSPGKKSDSPPIYHISSTDFIPTLLPSDLEKINNFFASAGETQPPTSARQRVLGSKEDRPDVSGMWNKKNPRQCSWCETVKKSDLRKCARCKLVFYCDEKW